MLASYEKAALQVDWPLIWTVLPVIQPELQLPPGVAGSLRIKSPPPFASTLQHLKNVGRGGGEEMLAGWPAAAAGPAEAAFQRILQHLEKEVCSAPAPDALPPCA